ncbi:MAG TPA: carboxypeptidase-like regulatory domain-containing protein [Flavobacteriaceae bacterium]|nr:carboxypeptidase-like regulatory domain-containing protein [Flavobacteriaceae bacterium]
MRKVLMWIFLFMNFMGFSQERVNISGEITVPGNANVDGITVFNSNSGRGTVTNETGDFEIAVAVNDSLVFYSVQFQSFTVIIDKGVVDSKKLDVRVEEAITELEQVIVRPYDLTGNVRVDVARVEDLEDFKQEFPQEPAYRFRENRETEIYALHDDDVIEGIHLINLFKLIFKDKKNDKVETIPPEPVEVLIRKIYQDEFFQKYMNIEEEKIDNFIDYAEREGLSHEMFAKGKELDLIEFLIEKSKEFNRQN